MKRWLAIAVAAFAFGMLLGGAFVVLSLRLRSESMGLTGDQVRSYADACIAAHMTWTPVYDRFGVAVLYIRCNPEQPFTPERSK